MDIPDLVKGALGDEEIQAGVSLGDEDAVCLTPTRTLVYRGEGLLSDEQVEEYSHDIEALGVSEGRRKTKFTMQYIDGTQSFTVPANRGDKVLGLFLEGVLRLDGVIDPRESVAGVYRFSELTLIIAEQRLIKHIGNQVWTEDFEVYPYEDVTGLEFERASVATSIALTVDGRPQRVKVPNDKAPVVRQTLEEALFGYYEVGSIDELNRIIGDDDGVDTGDVEPADADDGGFSFGDDFDPLVSDEDEELIEPVDADRPEQGAASGEPAGAQQPPRGGEPADRTTEPTPDQSQSAESGQQSSDGAQQRSESTPNQPDRGQQRSEPDHQQSEPTQQPSGVNQQSSEPAREQSASSGQQRPGSSGQPQSASTDPQPSESPSADPSSKASAGDATPSTPDERQQNESRAERSDQSAQGSASTATGSQASAGGSDRSADPEPDEQQNTSATGAGDSTGEPITREEYEALAERVEELTDAVDRQNELLKRQHRALKQLVQRDRQSE